MPIAPRAIRMAAIGCVAAFGVVGVAEAQDIGPESFRDSLVMRQIAFRAPCPSPVPASWTLADFTLGSGLRCSLVEAAVRALEQQMRQRPALQRRVDPRHPLCVRVVVARNTGSTGLPGDWLVLFDLAEDLPAYVMIDRQTGQVVVGIVGSDAPGDYPRCSAIREHLRDAKSGAACHDSREERNGNVDGQGGIRTRE